MIVRDFQLFRSTRNLENITPRRGIRQWPCADVGTYGGDPNDCLLRRTEQRDNQV
jgi:hypothetical protein